MRTTQGTCPANYPEAEPSHAISMQEPQSSSMVEDAEIGNSVNKEVDGADIKEEPIVQKAMELFEATKVTIQSKI